MVRPEHLEHAPIQEALIDIRASFPQDIDKLREIAAFIREDYPRSEERRAWSATVQVPLGGACTGGHKVEAFPPDGLRLWSNDGRRVLQVAFDGLTFNWLPPYRDWNALRDEARRLWDVCCGVIAPDRMNRVAVRFINRMELPCSVSGLGAYVKCVPRVPHGMTTPASNLIARWAFPDDGAGAVALTVVVDERGEAGSLVVLDIEAFREAEAFSQEDCWKAIDSLRATKNRVFFGSITAKTKDMYR